ncbi:CHY zinc finger protein [Alkalicoccus chagannorensis]|uniref:CHY zinc finger protein n=1 Tax=Alkalicoccus chagannorensis TaxID=427072 RepID=UPI0003FCFB4C|nr:CHY zinc finger protein [Alkalicoccus chagannorensis]
MDIPGAVDQQTRCRHYHGPTDVIALKCGCCSVYYPCVSCHLERTGRPFQRRRLSDPSPAVLCGVCGEEMSAAAYLNAGNACPSCRAGFNPGCAAHYHLYFEMEES